MWQSCVGMWMVAFMVVVSSAEAETVLPDGCFVTDEERLLYDEPPTCFNQAGESFSPWTTNDGYSEEDIMYMYGFQFGSLVNQATEYYDSWQDAEERVEMHSNSASVFYDWYTIEVNRNKRLKALEARLRRTCGRKCRKIKTVR